MSKWWVVHDKTETPIVKAGGVLSNNKLIDYCTLGYADVLNNAEFEVNVDDLLLSDMFIIEEYRDKGLATLLINCVLTNATSNVFVYATILDIKLKHYYNIWLLVNRIEYLFYRGLWSENIIYVSILD